MFSRYCQNTKRLSGNKHNRNLGTVEKKFNIIFKVRGYVLSFFDWSTSSESFKNGRWRHLRKHYEIFGNVDKLQGTFWRSLYIVNIQKVGEPSRLPTIKAPSGQEEHHNHERIGKASSGIHGDDELRDEFQVSEDKSRSATSGFVHDLR